MRSLLLLLLRGYQLGISPFLGQKCRFYPTCSNYAIEAIRQFGALKGSGLAGKRLCKCHPWHPGGYDPVPPMHRVPIMPTNNPPASSPGCSHS